MSEILHIIADLNGKLGLSLILHFDVIENTQVVINLPVKLL